MSTESKSTIRLELTTSAANWVRWATVLFVIAIICLVFFFVALFVSAWPRFLFVMFLFIFMVFGAASYICYRRGRNRERKALNL
jgi:CHASE3 domain sensor protein